MDVRLKPCKLSGVVKIPPSKSLAHRAIIAAMLANGRSEITNVAFSEDILATISAAKALGANIIVENDKVIVEGSSVERVDKIIDCNESGSTLRFFIPIALLCEKEVVFTGKNRLVKRPLDVYFSLFDELGISYSHGDDYLPLTIKGALRPYDYRVRGDVSSQFITGLLFALPLLDGDSTITITTPLESKGYVDLTLDILKRFGVIIDYRDNVFYVKGNQKYKPTSYEVEGDYSQSAFYFVLNMMGNDIKLLGLNANSIQGDAKILEDIKAFGGSVISEGPYIYARRNKLTEANISFKQTPDLGPALTVLASITPGHSYFYEAARLRIKECDRISSMREELEKLGAKIDEFNDGMDIYGSELHGGVVESHNDHRVVMALATLATVLNEDLIIKNAEAIKKSYPNFFDDFSSLGGVVIYE